jgi:hypothetical protein
MVRRNNEVRRKSKVGFYLIVRLRNTADNSTTAFGSPFQRWIVQGEVSSTVIGQIWSMQSRLRNQFWSIAPLVVYF